jgi:predicted small lipoprotein YifL
MDFLSQNTPSPGSSSRTKEHGRRSLNLLLLAAAMLAALMACGDPKYQPPAIVVTFDPNFPPPASLNTGAYAGIAAVVTNDTKNAGVNFSCIPDTPAGACGTFSNPGAGSAVPVCYLAPEQVPTENPVTVTATSVTDPTKFISAPITVVNGAANPCP